MNAEGREFLEGVARELAAAAERWAVLPGFPRPRVDGKLLRPLLAAAAGLPPGAGIRGLEELPNGFWNGALAIQMVHEASLLHDDILDRAPLRRGAASAQAALGIDAALVQGDHLLTAAYRLAAETDSLHFLRSFTRAVERTVAGEKAQAAGRGRWLSEAEYREMVSWKSGELFGCALALGRSLAGDVRGAELDFDLGVRVGCLYQMVDDFLDLCPAADLGKPPLQDLAQRKWTWPLSEAGIQRFEDLPATPDDVEALRGFLFGVGPSGGSPMARAFHRLRAEVERIEGEWLRTRPGEDRLPGVLRGWLRVAQGAMERESGNADGLLRGGRLPVPPGALAGDEVLEEVRTEAAALGTEGDWLRYFAHHARSFRFASRLFPREEGRLVAGVYAYCRFTDDLVDRAPHLSRDALERRLEAWMELTRRAHRGEDTGVPLLDGVLGETARRGVPAFYAEELVRGIAMDLDPPDYADLGDLRRYSYRVASVVGLWLTELFGTRTPWVLRRAEAMGHAMQLTNILRDVGEDFRQGRVYLPTEVLDRHGISRAALGAAVEGRGLPRGWGELMEELMAAADADYDTAFPAIPSLPSFFQGPVAVAARVYQGIHREIRKNGYDTLHHRAHTSLPRKLRLGSGALAELRSARRGSRNPAGEPAAGGSLPAFPGG